MIRDTCLNMTTGRSILVQSALGGSPVVEAPAAGAAFDPLSRRSRVDDAIAQRARAFLGCVDGGGPRRTMPFKPNYRMQRADRQRAKEQKQQKKLQRRAEKAKQQAASAESPDAEPPKIDETEPLS
ncbi:MAG TPA: hypothetical protein VJR47_16565 [Stellaceae bacterium]|nr:hypothetical protein [Stellaceae bacterium]